MTERHDLIAYHYFRLPRHLWELMLSRMRQLGASRLYTPVPWGTHEFEAGKFDLTGITNPRRDLVGFVDLCAAMGFNLLLDLTPGPISGANLLLGGTPGWFLRQHPEVRAKNDQGKALSTYTFDHPTYHQYATRWLEQISQALSSKQHPAGPITGVQIVLPTATDYLDHNDHILKVQWPLWLRKRYAEGGIEAINAAYGPTTPYRTVSQVPLTEALDSPAFAQDRADFIEFINQHPLETYTRLLEEQGWIVVDPIAPPPHGVQIHADPIDIGLSFQWAMEAPVQPDGSLNHTFWTYKRATLETLPADQALAEIRLLPADNSVIDIGNLIDVSDITASSETAAAGYRLLTNGDLLSIPLAAAEGAAGFKAIAGDEKGETDFYIILNAPEAPLAGYLDEYLASLLAGQMQTVLRCKRLAEQLATALQPAPHPEAPPFPPPLTEAQQSLEEASLALRKAAASIGALEEVFSTALNKPQPVTEMPLLSLLSIDSSQLGPVREACQAVAAQLAGAIPAPLNSPLTITHYQSTYQHVVAAAAEAGAILEAQLKWLREGFATGALPPPVRAVHHYVETILQSLTHGVRRL